MPTSPMGRMTSAATAAALPLWRLSFLPLREETVDPVEMARWSYEHGYWASGNGSYHALIPAAAKAWDLPVEGCGKDEGQKIVDALSDGKLIVALMDEGHFTNSGHFIVLRGVRDGKILVADQQAISEASRNGICPSSSTKPGKERRQAAHSGLSDRRY